MILIVDNYDSFTYNLVQYIGEVTTDCVPVQVVRNDQITVAEIERREPTHIIISPGPCTPNEAGISLELIVRFTGRFPILGVCLGHQAIGQAFGGQVVRGEEPVHGKTSLIHHDGTGIFANLDTPFVATRYHSLIIERHSMPAVLRPTAWTEDGVIMAVVHQEHPGTVGVQFHPESIMTGVGRNLLRNFLTQDYKT